MEVTEANLQMCEVCYARALAKGVTWEPTTSKSDILRAMRTRGSKQPIRRRTDGH